MSGSWRLYYLRQRLHGHVWMLVLLLDGMLAGDASQRGVLSFCGNWLPLKHEALGWLEVLWGGSGLKMCVVLLKEVAAVLSFMSGAQKSVSLLPHYSSKQSKSDPNSGEGR